MANVKSIRNILSEYYRILIDNCLVIYIQSSNGDGKSKSTNIFVSFCTVHHMTDSSDKKSLLAEENVMCMLCIALRFDS